MMNRKQTKKQDDFLTLLKKYPYRRLRTSDANTLIHEVSEMMQEAAILNGVFTGRVFGVLPNHVIWEVDDAARIAYVFKKLLGNATCLASILMRIMPTKDRRIETLTAMYNILISLEGDASDLPDISLGCYPSLNDTCYPKI